jgi:TonB family protein
MHLAALAWLQPRSRVEAGPGEFPLSVRLRQPDPPAMVLPVLRPTRSQNAAAPRTPARSLPIPPLAPAPQPEQPLRLRVVADPASYGAAAAAPEQRYAWPGQVDVSPFPPEGISVLYPDEALRAREKGLVVARIDVDRSGGVERLQLICSSPRFEQAVRDALAAVRFRPAFAKGQRVPSWILLEFAFLADAEENRDPAVPENALAALQKRCLEERPPSAQPAR